mmetsp:Transcript_5649/g.16803  ORF Transcript_5649/g.16803 Transcript_5649/m.16803 type:complete len:268 (-) Transcript_5649:557-1360(-)
MDVPAEHALLLQAVGGAAVRDVKEQDVKLRALDAAHRALRLLERHRHVAGGAGQACQCRGLPRKRPALGPLDAAGANAVEAAPPRGDDEPRLLDVEPAHAHHGLLDLHRWGDLITGLQRESPHTVVHRYDDGLSRAPVASAVCQDVSDRLPDKEVPVGLARRSDRHGAVAAAPDEGPRPDVASEAGERAVRAVDRRRERQRAVSCDIPEQEAAVEADGNDSARRRPRHTNLHVMQAATADEGLGDLRANLAVPHPQLLVPAGSCDPR